MTDALTIRSAPTYQTCLATPITREEVRENFIPTLEGSEVGDVVTEVGFAMGSAALAGTVVRARMGSVTKTVVAGRSTRQAIRGFAALRLAKRNWLPEEISLVLAAMNEEKDLTPGDVK